jgi:hypothetical protein
VESASLPEGAVVQAVDAAGFSAKVGEILG